MARSKHVTVCTATALLAGIAIAAASAQAPPTPAAQPQRPGIAAPGLPARDPARPGTGVIRGRVVVADTGRPLRKTQIRLIGAEVRESRVAQTDANGLYEIKDLPTGRFVLTASKAGYVQLQYGQLRAFEGGRPIDLRDGQVAEKIDFALPRGGVITGRVLDELGEPVVDAQIAAMRYQFVQGRRRLAPVGRAATTNDIGEFRLFGLLPGQYYVSATLRETSMTELLASGTLAPATDSRSGYAPTYYPGTTRAVDAERVNVAVGQTVSEIQISLSPIRTARVTGTVTSSDGSPVTTGAVMVMAKGDPTLSSTTPAQIDGTGSFVVNGLSPADYTLMAVAGNPLAGGIEFATADVTLAGDDVTGLQLAGSKPITVTGRVMPMSTSDRPIPLATMNVLAIAANPENIASGAAGPGKVNSDQTFEVKMMPGRALFRIGGAAGPWVIRSVRWNGEDVTETGIDFKAGRDVSGIEIELTNVPTTLTGAVMDGTTPSKDFVVVAFTEDRERWTPTTRMINISRPDQEGRYRIRVPGGNYFAAALNYIEPGEQFDPEFLAKLAETATRFTIASGESKTLDLKLSEHP